MGVLSDLFGYLLLVAVILYYLHYGWLKKYLNTMYGAAYYAISTVVGVIVGLVLLIPKFIIGLMKALLTVTLFVILSIVYVITYIVPFAGKKTRVAQEWASQNYHYSRIVHQTQLYRRMMVRIVAEHDNRSLVSSNPDFYREELSRVKNDSKNRLDSGETALSISLGILLLGSQITGYEIFQATYHGFPILILIDFWLLAIAFSIIYRVSILEVLAFPEDEDFETLEELDAALSYQKGVSLVEFVQGLMFVMVFVAAITNVKYETVEEVLEAKYRDDLHATRWLPIAWRNLRSGQGRE